MSKKIDICQGTAIGTTITGPGMTCNIPRVFSSFFLLIYSCQYTDAISPGDWNICVSSLLLVPSTWLSGILCEHITFSIFIFFEIEYEISSSCILSGIIHGYYGSQTTIF